MKMDYSKEENFINRFIRKNRRERLLYELTTPEKRYRGVSRFCHQAEEFLDHNKIILKDNDLEHDPKFIDFVKTHDEPCYVISPDPYLDDQSISLKEALDKAVLCQDALLILGSDFAIIFTEPMKGGTEKYLLSDD